MSDPHDLTSIRRDYNARSLTREMLMSDPVDQFTQWFDEAQEYESLDPTAMALATYSPSTGPSVRTVLLKHYDDTGFCWYTDYQSHKGQELEAIPRAEILFYWPTLERQIRINGNVSKVAREQSVHYFNARPVGSRMSAVASHQSHIIENRGELEGAVEKLQQQYPNGDVPCPENWGGYCLSPVRIEFWQGRSNRLHDRFCYEKTPTGWSLHRLSP